MSVLGDMYANLDKFPVFRKAMRELHFLRSVSPTRVTVNNAVGHFLLATYCFFFLVRFSFEPSKN
jgi:hypothetical protein